MSALKQRWISAAVGIPLFLGLALWGEVPFAVGVWAISCLGLMEAVRAYRTAGLWPNTIIAASSLVFPVWWWAYVNLNPLVMDSGSNYSITLPLVPPISLAAGIIPLALLTAMALEIVHGARTGEMRAGSRVAYGLLCGVYLSLFTGLMWLRSAPELGFGFRPAFAAAPLFATLFCVWATDSFAFFVGRAVGKRKLAPKLSPGKTVEGAIGGLVAGVGVGGLFGWLFFRDVGLGLTVGAIAGVFGQIGDLFESALKRELEIKDFGGILPGHGGVLDRFDSLLFVAPLTCLVFAFWRW